MRARRGGIAGAGGVDGPASRRVTGDGGGSSANCASSRGAILSSRLTSTPSVPAARRTETTAVSDGSFDLGRRGVDVVAYGRADRSLVRRPMARTDAGYKRTRARTRCTCRFPRKSQIADGRGRRSVWHNDSTLFLPAAAAAATFECCSLAPLECLGRRTRPRRPRTFFGPSTAARPAVSAAALLQDAERLLALRAPRSASTSAGRRRWRRRLGAGGNEALSIADGNPTLPPDLDRGRPTRWHAAHRQRRLSGLPLDVPRAVLDRFRGARSSRAGWIKWFPRRPLWPDAATSAIELVKVEVFVNQMALYPASTPDFSRL